MTTYPTIDDKLATLRNAIQGGVKVDSAQAMSLMELVDALGKQFKREMVDAARDEREAFEAWFRKEKGWFELPLSLDTGEWDAWQARASLDASADQAEPTEWSRTRSHLATTMAAFGTRPDGKRGMDAAVQALDAITEPGSPLSWLRNPAPMTADRTDAARDVRGAFEKALRETYAMVDPLNPPTAGTYYRGEHNGIIAALKTIRENFDRAAASPDLSACLPPDFCTFGRMRAYAFKDPSSGEHDPWFVVLPNAAALRLGYHADDSVDKAHAEFIAAAINRAVAEIERLDRVEGKS
jgi:hypothetical protein